jgi:hypothetical protein
MPAITRNMKIANSVVQPTMNSSGEIYEENMSHAINALLIENEMVQSKTAKMMVVIEIYDLLNKNLENLLHCNPKRWVNFAATVYNKTTEFEIQRLTNVYLDINVEIVNKHYQTYTQVRKFLTGYLKKIRKTQPSLLDMSNKHIAEAFKNIEEVEQEEMMRAVKVFKRPRRNVPVVDYTGMDAIEPYDESMLYDSDYDPEEDEDDEDDEDIEDYDDEEQDEELFKKKMQHVTVRKQTNLLPLLLFTRHDDEEVMRKNMPNVTVRSKRRTPRVDYSGMDMTEEDEGSVYVCETKWKDSVPTHRWVEYPASQANELDDEEWCEEY